MKKILLTVLLSLFLCGNTFAELKGIFKVKLLVEYLSEAAKKCSVTREQLETSVRYILSNSKIEIVDQGSYPILYLNSNIGFNSRCYANTAIEVYKYMKDNESNNWGTFIYYSSREISSGGTGVTFGDPYINSVEQQLKKLVVEHSNDN